MPRYSSSSARRDPGPSYTYSASRKGSSSSTSAYRRAPRQGYIASLWARIKRLWRQLYEYTRAHPVKILLPLVMALVSGGALSAVLAKFGLAGVGKSVEGMFGAGHSVKGGYDAWYGSQNVDGAGGGWGGGGSAGLLKGAVKVASAFL